MKHSPLRRTAVLCGLILISNSIQALAETDSIQAVQESTRKWTEIRLETVKLKEDWVWEKSILESTKDALAQRLQAAASQKKLVESETTLTRNELTKAKLENDQLKSAIIATEEHTQEVIDRLKQLKLKLPPRLSDALNLAYESLDDPQVSLGEKQQLIVTICNRCTQFNSLVTYSEEAVDPTGADSRVLQVIYLGLSQGYALDRSNNTAYYGHPEDGKWQWDEDRSLTGSITQLIDVFKEEIDPAIITVPANLD